MPPLFMYSSPVKSRITACVSAPAARAKASIRASSLAAVMSPVMSTMPRPAVGRVHRSWFPSFIVAASLRRAGGARARSARPGRSA